MHPLFTEKSYPWASLVILALTACLFAWMYRDLGLERKDFFNNLWAPAHLLIHGENPYNTTSLKAELPPVWLAPAVGLFSPLGWLVEKTAARIWYFWSLAALALLIFFSLRSAVTYPALLLAGLMAFFFPPMVNHLALGQFSITAALCCLLAAILTERRREWPAAFLLALALTKPQIAFLAVIGLGFQSFHRDGYRGLLGYILRLLMAAMILSLPVFIVSPGWIGDWLANLQQNQNWLHPSLFTVLRQWAGNRAFHLWGVVIAIGIEVCWLLWRRMSPREAMVWTLALTLIITPYVWTWDFVLLLPAWLYVFSKVGWKRAALLMVLYLAVWMGMAAIQLSADYNNFRFWWVPLLFMGGPILSALPRDFLTRRQP